MTSQDNIARYRTDVDKVFTGEYPSGKLITLGETPGILQQYGAKPLHMTLTQEAAYKIAYPEGYFGGKHNLGMSVLKQLPYQLENPIAILKSNTQENSFVILTEWMDKDKSIIIPVHLNKTGAIEIENRVASAYQTGHIQSYLGDEDRNVLYTKNNEDIHQLLSKGVQFPQAMADDILAKNSIPESGPEVKSSPLMQALFGDGKPAEPDRPLDVLEQEVQRLYGRRGAAAPEVKTDALTQILLDSIKPAERNRPLDVMEQEVQRLYGRRDSAAPEVKTDALTQILLDSIKPAERSRPLDVLEQEVQRLYGRRGAAAPEVKTDALTQILLDSIKPAERSRPLDVMEQEALRLYKEAQALPPQPGGDALIQILSGGGTAAPETAAESNAFLLGFQDDGDGPGTPEQLRVLNGSGSIPLWKSAGNAGPAKPGVPVQIGTVDFSDRSAVRAALDRAQEEAAELNYEVSCSVTTDGKVWLVSGEGSIVDPSAIPSSLAGSYSYHNHPAGETNFSFSAADLRFFFQSGEVYSKASDHVYEYVMARTPETLAVDPDVVYHEFKRIYQTDVYRLSYKKKINIDIDGFHEVMRRLSEKYHFIYRRWRIGGS